MSSRGDGRIGGRALLQLHSGRSRASRLHRLRGVGEGPQPPNHQPLVSQLLVVEFGVAGPPSCRGWPVGCSTRGGSRLITASRRGCAGLSRARRAVALGVAPGAPCLLMRWKRRAVALDVATGPHCSRVRLGRHAAALDLFCAPAQWWCRRGLSPNLGTARGCGTRASCSLVRWKRRAVALDVATGPHCLLGALWLLGWRCS